MWGLLAGLTISCGSETIEATATIGTAGGTLTLSDGTSLTVPADALLAATSITVRRSGATAPADVEALSAVYEFTPDGLEFAVPATIAFSAVDNPDAYIYWTGDSGDTFSPIATEVVDGTATGAILHFSRGLLGAPANTQGYGTCHSNFERFPPTEQPPIEIAPQGSDGVLPVLVAERQCATRCSNLAEGFFRWTLDPPDDDSFGFIPFNGVIISLTDEVDVQVEFECNGMEISSELHTMPLRSQYPTELLSLPTREQCPAGVATMRLWMRNRTSFPLFVRSEATCPPVLTIPVDWAFAGGATCESLGATQVRARIRGVSQLAGQANGFDASDLVADCALGTMQLPTPAQGAYTVELELEDSAGSALGTSSVDVAIDTLGGPDPYRLAFVFEDDEEEPSSGMGRIIVNWNIQRTTDTVTTPAECSTVSQSYPDGTTKVAAYVDVAAVVAGVSGAPPVLYNHGTCSGSSGSFSFELPPGTYNFVISLTEARPDGSSGVSVLYEDLGPVEAYVAARNNKTLEAGGSLTFNAVFDDS